MSTSSLLAQSYEKRTNEDMGALEKRMYHNNKNKIIINGNNTSALRRPFRVIENSLKKKNEAVKSAFLQAMTPKVRPHLTSHIGSYLKSRKHNAFAAKHKKRRTSKKKSKK